MEILIFNIPTLKIFISYIILMPSCMNERYYIIDK